MPLLIPKYSSCDKFTQCMKDMLTRVVFPMAVLLSLLAGCGDRVREYRSAEILEKLKAKIDSAVQSKQSHAVIPLAEPVDGSLIFAAPYSISAEDMELRASFGQSACSEMASLQGMGQSFHLFLVSDDEVKAAISWGAARFAFTGTISTESEMITSLCVDLQNGVLRAAHANCNLDH